MTSRRTQVVHYSCFRLTGALRCWGKGSQTVEGTEMFDLFKYRDHGKWLNTFTDASARRHLREGGGVSNQDILEVLKEVFKRQGV
jgi:hypothetical protein